MRPLSKFLFLLLPTVLLMACGLTSGFSESFNAPTDTPMPPTDTPTVQPTHTATASPSPTATPAPACPPVDPPISGWPVYCSDDFEFYFQYPPDAVVSETDFNAARIDLAIEPGTNLGEKYLELIVQESSEACRSPLAENYPPEMVESENLVIEGINYLKLSGHDAGAGNYWDWTAYSTGRSGLCVHFDFVLHSTNPYNYPTPPPEFDYDAETAVFEQIAGSLRWYD